MFPSRRIDAFRLNAIALLEKLPSRPTIQRPSPALTSLMLKLAANWARVERFGNSVFCSFPMILEKEGGGADDQYLLQGSGSFALRPEPFCLKPQRDSSANRATTGNELRQNFSVFRTGLRVQ